MRPRSFRSAAGQRSFTVVEILVACSVLVLILALLAQMMGIVNRAARQGIDRVDNFTKSRAMLDLICNDLQRGVYRPELPNFLHNVTNNTTVEGVLRYQGEAYPSNNAFYTAVAGPNTNDAAADAPRSVSLVYYALETTETNNPDMIVLQRYTKAVDNTGPGGANALKFDAGTAPDASQAVAQQTAPGVVAFRLMVRYTNGMVTDISKYNGYTTNGLAVAVGVSIAVLGNQALTELSNMPGGMDKLGTLADQYRDMPFDEERASYKQLWDANFYQTTNGMPRSYLTSFKTFERWVTCGPF